MLTGATDLRTSNAITGLIPCGEDLMLADKLAGHIGLSTFPVFVGRRSARG